MPQANDLSMTGRPVPGWLAHDATDAHAGMRHVSDLHAAARDMWPPFLAALAFVPLFVAGSR